MTTDLEPCPFCGGTRIVNKHECRSAINRDYRDVYNAQVGCGNCGAYAAGDFFCKTLEEAIKTAIAAWNRRVQLVDTNTLHNCDGCAYDGHPTHLPLCVGCIRVKHKDHYLPMREAK